VAGASPSREDAGPPDPFRLEHLILLGTNGSEPVNIHAMTFGDDGIGVVRYPGEMPRVLPWESVVAHAVEPWQGGAIPEWWVDPELNRSEVELDRGEMELNPGEAATSPSETVTDPSATSRTRPHVESGALVVIQSDTGVYRFIHPGGDARDLSRKVTGFAIRNQGPGSASSVTRVVAWGQDAERRKRQRPPAKPPTWVRMKPYLTAFLVVFVGIVIALILLQSAGTIHLPLLGGSSSGVVGALRTR
jgi:hypothetical protein